MIRITGSFKAKQDDQGEAPPRKEHQTVQAVRDKQVPEGRSPQRWAPAHTEILSASVPCRTGTLKDTEADGIW